MAAKKRLILGRALIQQIIFGLVGCALISLAFTSCTKKNKNKQEPLLINGAGASFPYILYSKWLSEYHKLKPLVQVNYQSIGSSGGIRQFLRGTLDFGATDIHVSQEELKTSNKKILHIPTTMGAVAVAYNLDIESSQLLLDGQALSKIFMGKITNWNDSYIQKLNPKIQLPKENIVVVYRADGSGTTSFFTEFLSKDPDFLNKVGKGKSVNWPVGIGGKGNEGVMGLVHKIKGSISYISLSYALSQKISVAKIKNKAGYFVAPSTKTIKAAADYNTKTKQNFSKSLINIGGKNSYPISGFTYIIITQTMSKKKGQEIVKFLKWVLSDGQKFTESLYFIPLPKAVISTNLKTLSQVHYQ